MHDKRPASLSSRPEPTRRRWALPLWLGVISAIGVAVAAIAFHYVETGELFGFLPESWRRAWEDSIGVEAPGQSEGHSWQLQPHRNATWPMVVAVVAILTLITWLYASRMRTLSLRQRLGLLLVRVAALGLILGVMLPGWSVTVHSFGCTPIVLAIDTSQSMARRDEASDPQRTRLAAAQRLLANDTGDLLAELLADGRHKLRLYSVGDQAQFLGEFYPTQLSDARQSVRGLRAAATSSKLGNALRQIVDENPGSPLIFWTDGNVTDGVKLADAAAYAKQRGTQLFLIGLGSAAKPVTVQLHDVQVSDVIDVNDNLVFEATVTGAGFTDKASILPLRLTLRDRNQAEPLGSHDFSLRENEPLRVKMEHRPSVAGEKDYVIEVRYSQPKQNVLAHADKHVSVLPMRVTKVLYVEGYPRFEYRALRSILERETDPATGKQLFELDMRWTDDQAAAATRVFPFAAPKAKATPTYDVLIFGDIDPAGIPAAEQQYLLNLVRVQGASCLWIAGERHSPHDLVKSALKDLLPIEVQRTQPLLRPVRNEPPNSLLPTATGKSHPLFRTWFATEATAQLPSVPLLGRDLRARPEADVLAWGSSSTPPSRLVDVPALAVVEMFVGAGRSLFFNFDETWRWRALDGDWLHRQFWLRTLRYLASPIPSTASIQRDPSAPLRRGDSVRILVHFPAAFRERTDRQHLLGLQRTDADNRAVGDIQIAGLQPVSGSRDLFESSLRDLAAGDYRVWLVAPILSPRPSFQFHVAGPPTEAERVRMDQEALQAAAVQSVGRFYLAANVASLPDDLPEGNEEYSGPMREIRVWDHPAIWGLVLLLLGGEWYLRRRWGVM